MNISQIVSIGAKGVIALGYLITVFSVFVGMSLVVDGGAYTRGAIQVVQLYVEAAGIVAIPLIITNCLRGIYAFSVSAFNDWSSAD
ncbi:hypothetical protein [Luminiphilus syltensis]|uniref:hypothetical protein n=1 Tax=Luminiphilus syltensis TaxID=1341119 RepID=UPI000590740F|nr:hypothetical protein [Luminiphilus syltensis]